MSFHSFDKKHKSKKTEPLITRSANQREDNASHPILDSNKNDQSTKKMQDKSKAEKPLAVFETLDSPGQSLDPTTRNFMETRFGYDFSQVRVHTGEEAQESTREVGAVAYTRGRDVVFGAKRYDPGTSAGRHLLAHELTHVVQQARGGASSQPEQRAEATAATVMRDEAVSPALIGGTQQAVQMRPKDPAGKSAKETPISTAAPGSWTRTLDKFGHDRSELIDDHRKSIDALATEIAARVSPVGARATITITGHTDTSGDEKYNESLGLKRAEATQTALQAALNKKQVSADRIGGITTKSVGEKNLAVETKDNVREPLNRRVVITVKIEGPSASVSPPTSIPSPDAKPEKRKKPIDLNLPPDYKVPEESLWERMERERKIIEEYDRKHPRKQKSLTDLLVDVATKVLEPLIRELPKGLRNKAREGIRKGIEAGTEKGCEAAIDASGVSGEKAEAMKAACKAALKTKIGKK